LQEVYVPIHNAATVLFEFKTTDGKAPDLSGFKRDFALGDHEVDDAYGFIPMQGGSFVTVITQDAAERVAAEKHPRLSGYFSNGRVDKFDKKHAQKGAAPDTRKPGGFGPFGPM